MVTPGPLQTALLLRSDPLRLCAQLAASGDRVSTIHLPAGTARVVHAPELATELLLERSGTIQKHLPPGVGETFGGGLFTSHGRRHAMIRHAAQPAFHRLPMEARTGEIRAMIRNAFAVLGDGEHDLKSFFEKLTLIITGRVLFGLDLSGIAAEFFLRAEQMQETFQQVAASPAAAERFGAASRAMDDLLASALGQPPAKGMVLEAIAATGELSDAELIEELRSFLLATIPTGLLLATACWLLAAHEDAQSQFRESEDALSTEALVHETLRLYPPGWLLVREAVTPFELDGIRYPANSVFLICLWTLHRSGRFFPEPEQFRPERWMRKRNLPRGIFIPFSLGPRSCIGERLSRLLARESLRPFVTGFRLLKTTKAQGEWLPRITYAPRDGIWVKLQATQPHDR